MMTSEKIASILEGIVPEFGAFVVDVHVNKGKQRITVQASIDTDAGIKIGECAAISRRLADVIDEQGLIESAYELEVSSPGIDRPLKLLRQYRKNVGRTFHVQFRDDATTRMLEGTLEAIDEDILAFRTEKGDLLSVRFADIIESKEVLPW
jgi:ribosome maturation factor RimP